VVGSDAGPVEITVLGAHRGKARRSEPAASVRVNVNVMEHTHGTHSWNTPLSASQ
jgi:hypothetical protein